MKKLIKLLIVVVLVLAAVIVGVFFYIDQIAETAVERAGTHALGVDTTLDEADVEVFAGRFSMGGLTVANPEGFDSPHFLAIGRGNVEVTLPTLMENLVTLPELRLGGIEMHLQRSGGRANYQVILDNLGRFEGEARPEDEKKFIIDLVVLRNIDVHVDLLPEADEATTLEIRIDRMRLKEIGSDTDGMVLAQVAGVLVKAVIEAVVRKGGDLLPADLLNDLQQQLAKLRGLDALGIELLSDVEARLKGAMEGAGEGLENVGEDIGEALEGVGGGLLGGENDQESGSDEGGR